jgi:hypothetical protein
VLLDFLLLCCKLTKLWFFFTRSKNRNEIKLYNRAVRRWTAYRRSANPICRLRPKGVLPLECCPVETALGPYVAVKMVIHTSRLSGILGVHCTIRAESSAPVLSLAQFDMMLIWLTKNFRFGGFCCAARVLRGSWIKWTLKKIVSTFWTNAHVLDYVKPGSWCRLSRAHN